MSSEPIRQPANDLIAFDISKQSPEQIAKLFARWKEQRKRLQAPEPRRRPPHLRPVPPIAHGSAEKAEEAAPVADTEPGGAVRYSASFEALLSAREPTLAQRVLSPDAGLAKLGRLHPPRRRSRAKRVLVGAASVVAVTAIAGGALWERSAGWTGWTQAGDKPDASLVASPAEAAPSDPMDIPMVEPFVAQATLSRQADWPIRQAVDLALMKTAPVAETAPLPLMPQLKPPVPVVRTASKPATKPAAAAQPEASEAPVAQVALPLVPSATATTVSVPVEPATETQKGDPRPNAQRGNDKGNVTFGSSSRAESSGGRPAGASGSGGSTDPGSGSAGGGTGGSGDSGSGGTGGDPGDGTGGSDPGGGDTGGNAGGGDTAGGNSGGGDSGGGDSGGDSGGGDSSGGDSGAGDSGGDSEGGDSGDGEGGSDDGGGIGGAIGGAIGGLGGALGGGKDKADKGKDKAD